MSEEEKKTAGRKKASYAWLHFVPLQNSTDRAVCKICKAVLSYKGSVSNLGKHLASRHPNEFKNRNVDRKTITPPNLRTSSFSKRRRFSSEESLPDLTKCENSLDINDTLLEANEIQNIEFIEEAATANEAPRKTSNQFQLLKVNNIILKTMAEAQGLDVSHIEDIANAMDVLPEEDNQQSVSASENMFYKKLGGLIDSVGGKCQKSSKAEALSVFVCQQMSGITDAKLFQNVQYKMLQIMHEATIQQMSMNSSKSQFKLKQF